MKKLIFIVPLLFVGCVQLIPTVKKTGENTYFLKTNGSALASPNRLTNKLNKKADTLCKGKGYEKLSDDLSLKKSMAYTTQAGPVPVGQITATLNIKCND
ncbi:MULTISPECIES: hypothetical protein [Acinetobacter]|jgi:hypothetical protein|uniref:hypothetical protein n=1 Tax=Acinetobacter TaxID=469 RepID=UPI000F690497|nr:hypothetical protein [Acinetobacter junii]RSE30750.1 hypothetical protein EGT62_14635 [Acinetobacter junii]RSE36976.1 hypothetical protein EGT64_05650 [Acinetobacter junii]